MINTTAATINTEAAAILDVANRINVDVQRINLNLDVTIPIAGQIRTDTDNINFEAVLAHKEASFGSAVSATPTATNRLIAVGVARTRASDRDRPCAPGPSGSRHSSPCWVRWPGSRAPRSG